MNFKLLILLSMLFNHHEVLAQGFILEEFDQFKMADLMGNLSTSVRLKVVTKFTAPKKGFEVTSTFPKKPGPFAIKCKSSYFGGALYPSYSTCEISVNANHPKTQQMYDEYKIIIVEAETVKALNEAIPYYNDEKEYSSHAKDDGTTFDGLQSNVFHYRIFCNATQCTFTFSNKF